ncbi:MAG TPA: sulfatase-like hydrolase/transferase [Anaerolineales bacterium]|nr:sulfatase-like hydrolase/transferase [Anaerolineales bacterium]
MKSKFNRRDFLKLAGLTPLSFTAPRFVKGALQTGQKNVLVVVFDAFTASNMSLYGYLRETTPNLTRLAERAIVYHNHYAGGNFTTPGTASLLTGTLPWTHRAFTLNTMVDVSFARKTIFHAFENYYRIAYSHNNVVNTLLDQFKADLDEFVPRAKLYLTNDGFVDTAFNRDDDIATVSWARILKKGDAGYAYSLFLSQIYELLRGNQLQNIKSRFPRGIPGTNGDNFFLLEHAIDWVGSRLKNIPQPFMGYFHFLPPHYPYRTREDFYGRFRNDGFKPTNKPSDIFSLDNSPEASMAHPNNEILREDRENYDEFILYIDSEFGRLFNSLESSGLLENTIVVVTSDHGELFERGIEGHSTAVLFQPVVHVPLLIFDPGRTSRLDVYSNTSVVDVIPTLLHLTGQNPIDWSEGGVVLPPFAGTSLDPNRNLFTVQARGTDPRSTITQATVMLVKGHYKLTYYFGYKRLELAKERIELYDLEADPEELNNLYTPQNEIGAELLSELKSKLARMNQPYL